MGVSYNTIISKGVSKLNIILCTVNQMLPHPGSRLSAISYTYNHQETKLQLDTRVTLLSANTLPGTKTRNETATDSTEHSNSKMRMSMKKRLIHVTYSLVRGNGLAKFQS